MTELEVWRLDLNQRISTKYLLQILSDIIEFGLYLCVMGEKNLYFQIYYQVSLWKYREKHVNSNVLL